MAVFARMIVKDSKKIPPVEFYPSWLVFTKRQKLGFPLYCSLCFCVNTISIGLCLWVFISNMNNIFVILVNLA